MLNPSPASRRIDPASIIANNVRVVPGRVSRLMNVVKAAGGQNVGMVHRGDGPGYLVNQDPMDARYLRAISSLPTNADGTVDLAPGAFCSLTFGGPLSSLGRSIFLRDISVVTISKIIGGVTSDSAMTDGTGLLLVAAAISNDATDILPNVPVANLVAAPLDDFFTQIKGIVEDAGSNYRKTPLAFVNSTIAYTITIQNGSTATTYRLSVVGKS